MRKVMVTGASGFIGNNIALYFQSKGYDVIGLDRIECHNTIEVEKVDMLNSCEIEMSLKRHNPCIVIHCAGSADVHESVRNPHKDFDNNVTITHNLLFAMHKLEMQHVRMVFMSSAGVYGNPQSLPITEDMPLKPMSPYAVHKVMCEDLCKYFKDNYGMNIKVARIFSAYGAGLQKQIFWDLCQKYKETGCIKVMGTGNESRDYIHIRDLVSAIYLLAQTDSDEMIFNVANGKEIRIKNVVEILARELGESEEQVRFDGIVREGDPLNWCADISKISDLGYKQNIDIQEGIKEYVDWTRNCLVTE